MKKLVLMSVIAAVHGSYVAPERSHAANSDGQAASFTTFFDRTTFLNSLPGPPTDSEDFEGFSLGANLQGVEFITGVNVTSNALGVEVFGVSGSQILFAYDGVTRSGPPDLYYDVHASSSYRSIGFDIVSFDPGTPGPGVMEVFFSDGTSTSLNIFPTNPTEQDPIFFGVTSDTAVERIRWTEGPETSGVGNEETALDNFVVGRPVPEPSTLISLGAGMLCLLGRRQRKHS